MEFFRFCPECKRRFHIKLENKKRLSLEGEKIQRSGVARTGGFSGGGLRGAISAPGRIVLVEGEPIIIDIEELQYNYKCKHRGTNGLRRE